jgi:hypothetical protein
MIKFIIIYLLSSLFLYYFLYVSIDTWQLCVLLHSPLFLFFNLLYLRIQDSCNWAQMPSILQAPFAVS